MKNQFPAFLEYFYYDILRDEARFSVKKLFGEWVFLNMEQFLLFITMAKFFSEKIHFWISPRKINFSI